MKFMLLLYGDETKWIDMPPEDVGPMIEEWDGYSRQLVDAGVLVSGEALAPTSAATTVRAGQDEVMRTDGPFAETREQLGGFYLLECKDIDEAAGWAAKVPDLGEGGCVEVRPVVDYTAEAEQTSSEATSA